MTNSNNAVSVGASIPKLSIFQRAKSRIFGAGSKPDNPALEMTKAIAEERKLVSFPQPPSQAISERLPIRVSATPRSSQSVQPPSNSPAAVGTYSKKSDFILIQRVKEKLKFGTPEQETAKLELVNRGYQISNEGKVTLQKAIFDKMNPTQKADVMKSGVSLVGIAQSSAWYGDANPVEYASQRELTFPEPPKKAPRTWQTYMDFSPEQVKKLEEQTGNHRFGKEARVEFFDAFCSMSPYSWRNPEKKNNSAARRRFYDKFKKSFVHCSSWGPLSESPNDPAPPVSQNAMTAQEFLALPEASRSALWLKMREQWDGRLCRAELKRAYRNGSPAVRHALRAVFELSLTLFPEEPV